MVVSQEARNRGGAAGQPGMAGGSAQLVPGATMPNHMGANGTAGAGGRGGGSIGGNFSQHNLTPAQRQQLEAQQRVLSPQQVGLFGWKNDNFVVAVVIVGVGVGVGVVVAHAVDYPDASDDAVGVDATEVIGVSVGCS